MDQSARGNNSIIGPIYGIQVNPYLPCSLINAWKIDSRDKLKTWWVVWVVGTTMEIDTVYSVFMNALVTASSA